MCCMHPCLPLHLETLFSLPTGFHLWATTKSLLIFPSGHAHSTPSPPALFAYWFCPCYIHHLLVFFYTLLPSDVSQPPEAFRLEYVKLLLSLSQLSSFASVKEHWNTTQCLKECYLCLPADVSCAQDFLSVFKLAYSSAVLFLMSRIPPPSLVTCAPK